MFVCVAHVRVFQKRIMSLSVFVIVTMLYLSVPCGGNYVSPTDIYKDNYNPGTYGLVEDVCSSFSFFEANKNITQHSLNKPNRSTETNSQTSFFLTTENHPAIMKKQSI